MSNNYVLKLKRFEGPLDLLLHLIRVNQLDIFDIDLLAITSQYLDYLRLIEFDDLATASSFMEMAASLCEIKSRNLIPSDDTAAGDEEFEEEDAAATLRARLVLYEKFQRCGEFFSRRHSGASFTVASAEWVRQEPAYAHIQAPLRGDSTTLVVLYEQMLSTLSERRPVIVKAVKESVTVDEIIEKMRIYIEKLNFVMFQGTYAKISNRYEFVANILAMLQLVRDRDMKIYQEEDCGPIWLYGIQSEEQEVLDHIQQSHSLQMVKQSSEHKPVDLM